MNQEVIICTTRAKLSDAEKRALEKLAQKLKLRLDHETEKKKG